MKQESFVNLVQAIYDGVLVEDGWHGVLEQLRQLTNSEHANLLVYDRLRGGITVSENAAPDVDMQVDYESEFCFLDPVRPVVDCMTVGSWFFDLQGIGAATMKRLPFYQDFMRRHGMSSIMCVPVINTSQALATISFQNGLARGAFEPGDCHEILPLLPHLLQAADLRWRFQEISYRAKLGQQLLDRVHQPVFVIDASARIHFANAAGDRWLSRRPISLSRAAAARQSPDWHQLQALAKQACSRKEVGTARCAKQIIDDAGRPTYLVALPLRVDHPIARHHSGPVALLIVHDPAAREAVWPDVLRELFGLTPSELRLIEVLCGEDGLVKSAAVLGIARETARSQLKSIYRKTGCRSQASLLQLIADLSQMQ